METKVLVTILRLLITAVIGLYKTSHGSGGATLSMDMVVALQKADAGLKEFYEKK